MSQNPENSYIAGLEASKQFAKRQLELSNQQAVQGANLAALTSEVAGLKQQVADLQEMVVTLTSPARQPWWRLFFNF